MGTKNKCSIRKRVTGIGGLFFKTKDPKASKDLYNKHLGFDTDDYGSAFW
ncbi:MAG: catechol-2,3-dioxygenase [Glaciecola sp.]|jgi:catechol-2,3-dioxygenase